MQEQSSRIKAGLGFVGAVILEARDAGREVRTSTSPSGKQREGAPFPPHSPPLSFAQVLWMPPVRFCVYGG